MEIRLSKAALARAEATVQAITDSEIADYSKYWDQLRPRNNTDLFRRYLFAFCSVHTTFAGNIRGYNAIRDYKWEGDPAILKAALAASGCGLSNQRTRFISAFESDFWRNPADYALQTDYSHRFVRDDIADRVVGLGLAKVSFALEMADPLGAQVVCGDVHHLRLYGLDKLNYAGGTGRAAYMAAESHWLEICESRGVPPYIARCVYWDKIQGQSSSKYWSYVLE